MMTIIELIKVFNPKLLKRKNTLFSKVMKINLKEEKIYSIAVKNKMIPRLQPNPVFFKDYTLGDYATTETEEYDSIAEEMFLLALLSIETNFYNSLSAAVGFTVPKQGISVEETYKNFVENNNVWLKGIEQQNRVKIYNKLYELSLANGDDKQKLKEELNQILNVTDAQIESFIITQINRLRAEIQNQHMEKLGIAQYKWVTRRDERVRSSHRAREGKIYAVAKGDNGVHPGQEWRCRCVAQPVLIPAS